MDGAVELETREPQAVSSGLRPPMCLGVAMPGTLEATGGLPDRAISRVPISPHRADEGL
jgi:hypothetical protein